MKTFFCDVQCSSALPMLGVGLVSVTGFNGFSVSRCWEKKGANYNSKNQQYFNKNWRIMT